MFNRLLKTVGIFTLCAAMAVFSPVTALADEVASEVNTEEEENFE